MHWQKFWIAFVSPSGATGRVGAYSRAVALGRAVNVLLSKNTVFGRFGHPGIDVLGTPANLGEAALSVWGLRLVRFRPSGEAGASDGFSDSAVGAPMDGWGALLGRLGRAFGRVLVAFGRLKGAFG